MPTFIMLTKRLPSAAGAIRSPEEVGKEIGRRVRLRCPNVVWKSHYATLGRYDFVDIFDARDEAEAAEVAYITSTLGNATTETWTALPYERFLHLAKDAGRQVGGSGLALPH
jgi:uncharacterized protein with GYD domain